MHEVLVNRLGGLSLPRKSVVRLTDCPDMTTDVYLDVKQQCNKCLRGGGVKTLDLHSIKYSIVISKNSLD